MSEKLKTLPVGLDSGLVLGRSKFALMMRNPGPVPLPHSSCQGGQNHLLLNPDKVISAVEADCETGFG